MGGGNLDAVVRRNDDWATVVAWTAPIAARLDPYVVRGAASDPRDGVVQQLRSYESAAAILRPAQAPGSGELIRRQRRDASVGVTETEARHT